MLEEWSRLLPADHPDLLIAKLNLAASRKALGDISGAKELEESVLEAGTRTLPPDHVILLMAMQNLAATRGALGDHAGALDLEESLLAARTRRLPQDHPDLLTAKQNLASTRKELGDLNGAKGLEEAVLQGRASLLPPDHPDLLAAKQNLAATLEALGDFQRARELEESVLEARTRALPSGHPDLLKAKGNLAITRRAMGDIQGACELVEAVHTAFVLLLPPDHPDLLQVTENLSVMRAELGEQARAKELVSSMLAGMRLRAGMLRADAARPAREGAREELRRYTRALYVSAVVDPEHTLDPELFATLASLRTASVAGAEAAHAMVADPELAASALQVAKIRAKLNDLVAAGPEKEDAAQGYRAELVRLAEGRDSAERGLRQKLAEAGAFAGEIDAGGLGARLAPATGALSFLRYARQFGRDPVTGKTPAPVESMLAFLVKPGGGVARVELGPAAELETLVGDWRAALGRPLQGRGIGVSETGSADERLDSVGTKLRERLLDPLLAALGEVHELYVELDDVLYLIPLDALPLGEGLVGQIIVIHPEATMARLLRNDAVPASDGELLLAGGIDYDAELGKAPRVRSDASTPPMESASERSASGGGGFSFLPGTVGEMESVSRLYAATFERDSVFLSGSDATKAALHAAVSRARFLHLATHGWFASEAFKSQLDTLTEQSSRDAFQRAEHALTGFAPETLCGLALAGANRGKDALGRVPGILTAEELATFDLRNCERMLGALEGVA